MNQVVICAACDIVFREHDGRHSCPLCGGDPGPAILELEAVSEVSEAEAETPSEAGSEKVESEEAISEQTEKPKRRR